MADLGDPIGSQPGYIRPILVLQDNRFNDSSIATVITIAMTSNLAHARFPGNVVLQKSDSGLDKDSIIIVSQIVTIDKSQLLDHIGSVPQITLDQVEYGISIVLGIR